jgi:acyl-CoA synthetase (AMP-forming)/AMP-acid ligase II
MIFRSPHPDLQIPKAPLTQVVLRHAARLADKPAFIDGASGAVLTYRELAENIEHAAAGLAARGLRKGDVAAILSPNAPHYAVVFHAVAMLGGICTTVNPLYTADEIRHQLEDSGAKYLMTVPALMDKARASVPREGLREIFVFGEAAGATAFASLLESSAKIAQSPIDPVADCIALPYSSGTTGKAKGVKISHFAMVANLCQAEGGGMLQESDITLCVLPFFHIYGLTLLMNLGPYVGATVVTLPRFDPEQFLHCVQEYRVTYAPLVPPIVLFLAKHPLVEKYDLSSLRFIGCGAAPLGKGIQQACSDRLKVPVLQGYGMTEMAGVTHLMQREGHATKSGSVGPGVPNCETMIIDLHDGRRLGPGEEGEIWVRSPSAMLGYHNRLEETSSMLDRDGWLHTGDIGYADHEGYIYIVDRLKELIKYKAYQVAPAELEALLLTHPKIADAAVIPSLDAEGGEVPKAFVVVRETLTAEEVMTFVEERVAPFKKIRRVEFVELIPKSPSGKILRRVLVERERAMNGASK